MTSVLFAAYRELSFPESIPFRAGGDSTLATVLAKQRAANNG